MEFENNQNAPVHTILADNDFQSLREDIEELGINVHVVTKDEHVPEVERQNRVVKERARAIIQTLPYRKIPRKMRIALIHYVVFCLNNIPKENQTQSPRDMIMGQQILDYKSICKLPFGAYVQVHDDAQITNTMEPRTTGGINLGPNNMLGGHKFLNLTTGDVIVRRKWTELPVPSEVILRLEELSTGGQDDVIEDILHDEEEEEPSKTNDVTTEDLSLAMDDINPEDNPEQDIAPDTEQQEIVADDEHVGSEEEHVEMTVDTEEQEQENEANISTSDETAVTSNTASVRHQSRYNLRPNCTPNYLRRFAFLSVQAGIKKWGDKAREAVKDELRLFIKEKVFKGLQKPTQAQMRKALMIHCFIIEKRDGRIKARAVADGRGQTHYSEEETYSPTVKLESIILQAFIDAYEGRHVATVDIKGAFLKAPVPEELELVVKMTGEMAQMMCELDPELQCDEHGVLYLQCEKALYGHIEAARLFYDHLNDSIQHDMHFMQNKYDPCVYNRQTPDGVVTIRVHVDDLKISAQSKKQLEYTIEQLRRIW
jgi:hypothetical protein